MVDSYEISDDNLTYTFTLREGLLWHDGEPVTSEDAIASIERWGQNDSMGQLLMSFVDSMKAVDDKTFEMQLKEPYGLVLLSLAKPSSNVPFMMPRRIAETPAGEQISEYVGSGPFVFERDEWEPGNKAVFTKFGTTSRGTSRRPGRPAARSRRSIASSGSGSPTTRPRSMR